MERAVPSMERVIASNVGTGHVGSFGLRDFLQLSAGNFTYFVFVRLAGTRLDTSRFSAEQLPEAFW